MYPKLSKNKTTALRIPTVCERFKHELIVHVHSYLYTKPYLKLLKTIVHKQVYKTEQSSNPQFYFFLFSCNHSIFFELCGGFYSLKLALFVTFFWGKKIYFNDLNRVKWSNGTYNSIVFQYCKLCISHTKNKQICEKLVHFQQISSAFNKS